MANPIAILGGTFDPPHCAHLVLATGVADELGLDQVLLIPTGNPHFKQDVEVTSVADRVAMTELLAGEDSRLQVSTIEAEREGITYTADTLKVLQEENPGAELLFIIGGDCAEHIMRWHAADEIARLCTVVAVARPGYDFTEAQDALDACDMGFNVRWLHVDTPDVSSTDIRARAAAGQSLEGLVPASVEAYIRQHDLYRQPETFSPETNVSNETNKSGDSVSF